MADPPACEAILDLLARMESDSMVVQDDTVRREADAIPPDHGGGYEFRGATTFTLNYRKGVVPDDHWILEERNQGVVLTVGHGRLRELRDAAVDRSSAQTEWATREGQQPWRPVARHRRIGDLGTACDYGPVHFDGMAAAAELRWQPWHSPFLWG